MWRSQRPRATYCASRCAVSGRSVRGVWEGSGGGVCMEKGAEGFQSLRFETSNLLLPLGDDGERGDLCAGLCGADGGARVGRRLVRRGEELFEPVFDRREADLALEERGEAFGAEEPLGRRELLGVVGGLRG